MNAGASHGRFDRVGNSGSPSCSQTAQLRWGDIPADANPLCPAFGVRKGMLKPDTP